MKTTIFIDGQNFYKALQRKAEGARVDYDRLARWLCEFVKGEFAGAYYYVGTNENITDELERFLSGLEARPGYFVMRGRLATRRVHCRNCDVVSNIVIEKAVDVRLTVDMLHAAYHHTMECAILLSGDE